MIDKISLLFYSFVYDIHTVKTVRKLLYATIAYVSSIFAFSVLVNDLTGCYYLEDWCKSYWIGLFIIGIVLSFVHNRYKFDIERVRKNDGTIISVQIKDLFASRANSYVIPTNSYFRTIMEREYISPRSVQGAFQLRCFKNNCAELDRLIAKSLEEQSIDFEAASDIFGDTKKYPLGTVAKVDYKGKHYYFVAINDVNEYGKPVNQTYDNINVALNGLFDSISKMGHCDDLAIPLIGTGKAAIKEATIDNVVKNIIDSYFASPTKLSQKLIVCIHPKDFRSGKVDFKRIEKYVDYKCEFDEL